jgi:hypothetical protein
LEKSIILLKKKKLLLDMFKCKVRPGMLAHACNPATWEAEDGRISPSLRPVPGKNMKPYPKDI